MTGIIKGPGLRAEVQADRGARIVSLRGDDGFEWLAASERTASGGLGQPFVRSGMGGWDEVAPTVQADPGMALLAGAMPALFPDHGDLWNVPWTVEHSAPDNFLASVNLVSMPIHLERRITATDSGLRFSYRASTASEVPLPIMWCAHPQFRAGTGAVVSLELEGRPIVPRLTEMYPRERRARNFPTAALHDHLRWGASLKAFVDPAVRTDAAVLLLPSGRSLRLGWDPEQLPYLGLFWDNGEFAAEAVLAVEPSTAWGERLSTAVQQGRALTVARDLPLAWTLDLAVGETPVSGAS